MTAQFQAADMKKTNRWLSYNPDDPESPKFSQAQSDNDSTMEQHRLADGTFELKMEDVNR